MNKVIDMKSICKQSTTFFGSPYNIHIGVSNLNDNLEYLVMPHTITFIDYVEKICHININYELNRLLELIDSFNNGDYRIPQQILNPYQEYFNNLEKNHQIIEKLFKDFGLENSLNLLRQAKLIHKEYDNKVKKHIEIAKKHSLEEIEKIVVELSKNFITKAGIPLLLYYLADIKQVKWMQKIAKLLLANHPNIRLVLLMLSCSMLVYKVYSNIKDKDKKIKCKNIISIYFGHILYLIDMMYNSQQSSYFINIVNEQYGAFRIENIHVANDSALSKIVIATSSIPTIFHSSEHIMEFYLSHQKIIDTKNICNNDRSFAQLSLFTGLSGAIYDSLQIQQNPMQYLAIKFYDFVQSHQKYTYNYISYKQVAPKVLTIDNQIAVSSSFIHIKNLFLKSHNFILAKTKSFSSIVIYDLLSQSLKTSQQNNKPLSKDVLIITTPLHTESFEYQIQKHIKELCINNINIQRHVTFMTPICRINKEQYFISLQALMLEYAGNIDRLIGDNFDIPILAFLTHSRKARIKNAFLRVLMDNNGYLTYKNIDYDELVKLYLELQDIVKTMDFNPFLERQDTNSLIARAKAKYPNDKDAIKKAFEALDNNVKLLVSSLNDFSILLSYFVDNNIKNIDGFKQDVENKKNDIEQVLQANKDNLPNHLIQFSQIAINEYLLLQDYTKEYGKLEKQILNIYESIINSEATCAYQDLFSSIDTMNTNIIVSIVEKILPIPHYIFIKILTEATYIKFCYIIFIDCIIYNKTELLVGAVLISEAIKTMTNEVKQSNTSKDFTKNFWNNSKKTIGDKAIANFFNKPTLTNSAIYLMFGINQPEDMIQSTIKNFLEIHHNIPSYKVSIDDLKSFGINFLIDFTIDSVFDRLFPNLQRDSLREEIAMLLLLQRRYKPMPYAKWEKDSLYMYVPDTIQQTFVSADFTAMLIGGSPFNSGCCIHNPSIAGFVQDKALSHEHTLKILRKYICGNQYNPLSLNAFHTQSDSIFKEAYCKILHYIGLAKDEHTTYLTKRIPNITKEQIKILFNPQTLMDTQNLIKTKIKRNSNANNNDDNFIASKAMAYSRDFLIQLKRIAEYNYLVYSGSFDERLSHKKTKKKEVQLLGSLIYDKGFIPTIIDVKD